MRTRLWKNLIFLAVAAGLVFAMVRYAYEKPAVRLKPGITRTLPSHPPVEPGRSGMPPCWLAAPELSGGQPVVQGTVGDCLVLVPGEDKLNVVEVNLFTGALHHISTDLFLPAQPAIAFTRVTHPLDDWARKSGFFLPHLYDLLLFGDRHPYTYAELVAPDRIRYRFERISLGGLYKDALYRHEATRTTLYGSELSWNGNGWDLRLGNGFQLVFPEAELAKRRQQGAPVGLRDPSGNLLRLLRDREGNLLKVVSQDGQWLELQREGEHIRAIRDSRGGVVQYWYDGLDRLRTVVLADATTLSYSYDNSNRITALQNGDRLLLRNEYDDAGQVAKLTLADGQSYCFAYAFNSAGNPQETWIVDSNRRLTRVRFHERIYEISASSSSIACK